MQALVASWRCSLEGSAGSDRSVASCNEAQNPPSAPPLSSTQHSKAKVDEQVAMHSWLDQPLRNGREPREWKPGSAEEAAANIDKWYNAGRLLYPLETLQSIKDQLQKPLKQGDLIYVKGFDGEVYGWLVRIGEVQERYARDEDNVDEDGWPIENKEKKEEWVFCSAKVHYTSYESLKNYLEWDTSRAYCPIGIAHLMVRKDQEAEAVSHVDVEAGLESFKGILEEWEGGDTWRGIKSTLLTLDLRCKIPKVIGMACGRFTATKGYKGCKRSAVQHALLVLLKRALQESNLGTEEVTCYAQDPVYSPTDQAVMKESGIKVVDDPEGFLQMDDSSLVFCCSPNICVKQIMADMARPAIVIWCAVEENDPKESSYVLSSFALD